MKIGVLGTGAVGRTLGTGFADAGDDVMMGARDAANAKARAWVAATGRRASAGTFVQAAEFGDVIVLATLWSGTENAIKLARPAVIGEKVVMDVTNPLVFTAKAPPAFALGHRDSGGQRVQRLLPKARVVKVFNTVGTAHMVNPEFPGGPPDMFICGNDDDAKRTVTAICQRFGWPTIDIGGMEDAQLLEAMYRVWVLCGLRSGGWNHAFKLLRR